MRTETIAEFMNRGGKITKCRPEPTPVSKIANAKGKSWTQGRPGAIFRG